mmetsp:Transcript_80483/g.225856  ORF Transcript_80483/g.225856 Transcript_80483/m.225856 type:complete len:216 (+) Transcript_80483:255-902(+)
MALLTLPPSSRNTASATSRLTVRPSQAQRFSKRSRRASSLPQTTGLLALDADSEALRPAVLLGEGGCTYSWPHSFSRPSSFGCFSWASSATAGSTAGGSDGSTGCAASAPTRARLYSLPHALKRDFSFTISGPSPLWPSASSTALHGTPSAGSAASTPTALPATPLSLTTAGAASPGVGAASFRTTAATVCATAASTVDSSVAPEEYGASVEPDT